MPERPDTTAPDSTDSTEAAAEVVGSYYDAIERKEYRRAYELWGGRPAADGQTYAQFAAGFAVTAHVEVEIGEPGRVEGSYTVRRVVVDGAPPAQRAWHLDSARLVRTR